MSGRPNNQDNLDDVYSDLSDNDQKPKRKNSNTPVLTGNQPTASIKMPSHLGGRTFIPPPPPSSSKNNNIKPPVIPPQILQQTHKPQSHNFPSTNNLSQQHFQNQNKQRKTTVYIKNIPKSCNRQQTLTTFFRTFGNIKSIKTYQQQNSAFVRFEKQQDVLRFMTNKPLILNRSYIIYDTNQDFPVLPQHVQQRQKDEHVSVGQVQKQVIILKENMEVLVADKYRCLLYLHKNQNRLSQQKKQQVRRQMAKCRKIKESQTNDHQLGELLMNFQNDYQWTLVYHVITKQQIDKKKLITQFNKYGPIGTISVKLGPLPTQSATVLSTATGTNVPNESEDKQGTSEAAGKCIMTTVKVQICQSKAASLWPFSKNGLQYSHYIQQQKTKQEQQMKIKQQKMALQAANIELVQKADEPKQENRDRNQKQQFVATQQKQQQNVEAKLKIEEKKDEDIKKDEEKVQQNGSHANKLENVEKREDKSVQK